MMLVDLPGNFGPVRPYGPTPVNDVTVVYPWLVPAAMLCCCVITVVAIVAIAIILVKRKKK